MASASASIPRFLLPQSGAIWRRAASGPAPSRLVLIRFASSNTTTSSTTKPAGNTLAKPTRFNPPSHGARLPRNGPPRHYGGDLSADEAAAQFSREYPGLPPPKNTLAHWFIHSRWIHIVITLGTLSTLALYTFILSFRETTPHYDLLPSASDFLYHPLDSVSRVLHVMRLHDEASSARIEERRQREVNDVGKRAAYRRAHGLPMEYTVFGKVLGSSKIEEVIEEVEEAVEEVEEAGKEVVAAAAAAVEGKEPEKGKKKWLGIW
ncbi:hypothetical protein C8A05DRAFT_36390 [Staphylotrichum tortipilum]|uniref:Uncharacterized protein n=1 Tax=Staphylotrichum tortipilum TaxID=2831512 RepID=A0AAN6RR69_9PEZI|nr:hypothetical protein C8A05DRAFT_36390 [Staphylotrichum longicolle]